MTTLPGDRSGKKVAIKPESQGRHWGHHPLEKQAKKKPQV